ncbi:MAG: LuxR family transcriptional regulator [Coriobacteriia bacterium]|nr:LuxR family transcriptional regulator [Coriobacteriia bacterium]
MANRRDKSPFVSALTLLWPGLPYLGFGVLSAWYYLAYSGTFWLSDTEIDGRYISYFYLISTGVFAAVILLAPIIQSRLEGLLRRPWLSYLGAGVAGVGALLIILAGPYYLSTPWMFYSGCAITGVGTAPLALKCGQLYGRLTPARIVVYVVLSQILVATVYFLFLGTEWFHPVSGGPSLSGIIGLVLLPAVVAFLVTLGSGRSEGGQPEGRRPEAGQLDAGRSEGRRPEARQPEVSESAPEGGALAGPAAAAAAGVAGAAAAANATGTAGAAGAANATAAANVALAVGAVEAGGLTGADGAADAADAAQPERQTAAAAARPGIARVPSSFWKLCIVVLFFALVTSVVRGLAIHADVPNATLTDTNILMLLRLLFAFVFLYLTFRAVRYTRFGRLYLILMVVIAVAVTLASSLQFFGRPFTLLVSFSLDVFDILLWCMLAFIVSQTKASFVIIFGFGRGAFAAGSALGWMIGAWVFPQVSTFMISLIFIILATLVLVSAILVFSEKDFDDLFSSIFETELALEDLASANGATLVPESEANGTREHARPYIEACTRLGGLAHLTTREQDIFELLALGRGSDNIAQRLQISQNTARTHTHNIYTKLDVHSRQELITLVESTMRSSG